MEIYPIMRCLYCECFVVLLIMTLLFSSTYCTEAITREQLIGKRELNSLEYEDTPQFLEKLRSLSYPTMITSTPAHTHWKSMKLWPPKDETFQATYLSSNSHNTVGVKQHSKSKFTIGCCPLQPMTQREFWTAMKVLPEGRYMYFNSDISLLDSALQQDVQPSFFSKTHASASDESLKKTITNVWMGSKGSTAALHHDPFDNFFVQIHGRKKITLFSPDLHHAVYLYPKTHPSTRQAQIDIDRPNLERFPRMGDLVGKGIEIIVSPGDVLYLPPLWFHQIESLGPAISINTWFTSPAIENVDLAWNENLPFNDEWNSDGFAIGLKTFLLKLLRRVLVSPKQRDPIAADTVKGFLQALMETRFQPLYGESPSLYCDLLRGIGTTEDPHLRVHLKEQKELDSQTLIPGESLEHLAEICRIPTQALIDSDPKWLPILENSVKFVGRHFLTVDRNSGVQISKLEDFVEDLIGQAVGDKSVYFYLKTCMIDN